MDHLIVAVGPIQLMFFEQPKLDVLMRYNVKNESSELVRWRFAHCLGPNILRWFSFGCFPTGPTINAGNDVILCQNE